MVLSEITYIVIHCADTLPGQNFTAADINAWHKQRGFRKIGYHFVVLLDGTIEQGRDLKEQGAHVKHHNKNTISVCYIGGAGGEDTRTLDQKVSLIHLVASLKRMCENAVVVGHSDFEGVTKLCPSFNAKNEYKFI